MFTACTCTAASLSARSPGSQAGCALQCLSVMFRTLPLPPHQPSLFSLPRYRLRCDLLLGSTEMAVMSFLSASGTFYFIEGPSAVFLAALPSSLRPASLLARNSQSVITVVLSRDGSTFSTALSCLTAVFLVILLPGLRGLSEFAARSFRPAFFCLPLRPMFWGCPLPTGIFFMPKNRKRGERVCTTFSCHLTYIRNGLVRGCELQSYCCRCRRCAPESFRFAAHGRA